MGKIVISENVTLDGVVQDPAGVEGFRLGGWIGRIGDRGRQEADIRPRVATYLLTRAPVRPPELDRATHSERRPVRSRPL